MRRINRLILGEYFMLNITKIILNYKGEIIVH